MTIHELQIGLTARLGAAQATVPSFAHAPAWRMDHNGVVPVNVEPFDQPPDEIHRTFLRLWRYYRS